MSPILKECTDPTIFSQIVDCEWAAYYNPYNPFMQILFPVFGADAAARSAAIQESKERQWQWHSADPTSHWLYVEDEVSGAILGGAQWHVYETNPWAKPQSPLDAYWWPQGECRRFVNEMLEQVYGPRRKKMARPHTLCNLMFVHPQHRRRGVGRLLMDWGVEKAKELGIECFVEATDLGRPLYERCGLHVMYVDRLRMPPGDASDEWRKMERELFPMYWYFMWRPADGTYVKDQTALPWEEENLPS